MPESLASKDAFLLALTPSFAEFCDPAADPRTTLPVEIELLVSAGAGAGAGAGAAAAAAAGGWAPSVECGLHASGTGVVAVRFGASCDLGCVIARIGASKGASGDGAVSVAATRAGTTGDANEVIGA